MAKIPVGLSTEEPHLQNNDAVSLRRQLQSGRILLGGIICEYLRPSLLKLYCQAGFDFAFIEYEHAWFEPNIFGASIVVARDNKMPVIAKVPVLGRAEVAKLLDAGVLGIQLPRTESRAEIETLQSYLKYPPQGTRAIAPGFGNSDYCQPADWRTWMDQQNRETVLVVHIETQRGYERAEEIISTPGVDMVYIGPGDFSIAMGHPGNYDHPDVLGPMEKILAICQRYNVAFGTTASGVEGACQWIAKKGAQFFEVTDELSMILSGASQIVARYREIEHQSAQVK